MDIISNGKYPSNKLSNFAIHPFELDGVKITSMEGFLQSLKFSNPAMQEHVCTLHGAAAKKKGYGKNWWTKRILYWRGEEIDRDGQEYQDLLDRAYFALAKNEGFRRALMATGHATLTHSIGKKKKSDTILTEQEFCSRLMKVRYMIAEGKL